MYLCVVLLFRVKYTGVLGLACVGLLTVCDLWQLVGDHALNLVMSYLDIHCMFLLVVGLM